ncbi:MAG: MFS transporter, partial [Alphaproteobacteria bacterium]|nr:MFS transporter [Alphaproteobacteria bacterium]
QLVAIQAIGALVLGLSASQLGVVQASILLPALFLMLPAGVTAENNDGRKILIWAQALAFFPALFLGILTLTKWITFPHLIMYGLLIGALGSFVMPARDALLSHIVDNAKIQRAVNIALSLQFTGMLCGMVVVSGADFVDIGWMPILQAVVYLIAAYVSARLPKNLANTPKKMTSLGKTIPEMIDGIRISFAHKDIAPVLLIQFGISICFIGMFMVILPLFVRDYYGGGAGDIALLNMLFWVGTIVAMVTLIRLGLIPAVGKMLLGGVSTGLLIVGALAVPKPFWALACLCVVWGIAAGCSMSSGRTIIQNRAPDSHRARILSVYQFSFMGGAPFGALLTGLVADRFGVHAAPLFSMAVMGVILLSVGIFSQLRFVRLSEDELENVEATTRLDSSAD